MLSSLPVLHPRDSHNLWYTPSSTFSYAPPPSTQHGAGDTSHGHSDASQSRTHNNQNANPRRGIPNGHGTLRQLELEEASIQNRKNMIQLFGATWIKPPGLAKTYQGELDEKAEREEAAQREQDELAAVTFMEGEGEGEEQDLDADIPEGSEVGEGDEDEDDLGEDDEYGDLDDDDDGVDLDADIPEAEAETLWGESDEEEEEEEEEYEDDELGYASAGNDVASSTRTAGTDRTDESPQQAMFSHDETFPETPRHARAQGLDWRGRPRYRREEDSMDMDSD